MEKELREIIGWNCGGTYVAKVEAVKQILVLFSVSVMLPSGKDWDKYIISPSILKDKNRATAYEAGFKDCLIEIKNRKRKSN